MTAQSIALGLRSKYPLQAARAKAFRKWMQAWAMGRHPRGPKVFAFWCSVCLLLDKETSDVC